MTDELEIFRTAVAKFVDKECVPRIDEWEEAGAVDRETWRKAGQAALILASAPVDYGGSAGTIEHEAIIIEELSRKGANGFLLPTMNLTIAPYIFEYAREEQKLEWGHKIARGELLGAIAFTEPGTGSDLQAIRTSAKRDGDHYVINGQKIFTTGGHNADFIIVACCTGDKSNATGISLIVVETENLEGFSRGRKLDKIGLRAHDTAELFFDNVRVPAVNLLGGQEGCGFRQMMTNLPQERLQIALESLAMIERALEVTIEYTKDRHAFGQRIIDFQNSQFVLAECKTEATIARVFCQKCIEMQKTKQLDPVTASMAKLWVSELQCKTVDRCLQLFGGYGYMNEYPIARMYRDARVARIYGGTSEIMKLIIGRSL